MEHSVFFQPTPAPPIVGMASNSADYATSQADAMRALRIIAGEGIKVEYSPNGVMVSVDKELVAPDAPKPWDCRMVRDSSASDKFRVSIYLPEALGNTDKSGCRVFSYQGCPTILTRTGWPGDVGEDGWVPISKLFEEGEALSIGILAGETPTASEDGTSEARYLVFTNETMRSFTYFDGTAVPDGWRPRGTGGSPEGTFSYHPLYTCRAGAVYDLRGVPAIPRAFQASFSEGGETSGLDGSIVTANGYLFLPGWHIASGENTGRYVSPTFTYSGGVLSFSLGVEGLDFVTRKDGQMYYTPLEGENAPVDCAGLDRYISDKVKELLDLLS